MTEEISDLYKLPNIGKYEDIHLLDLSESCARLEEKVLALAKNLPDKQRGLIEAYISTRDDLEVETFKTALCWGKVHYK